MYQTVYVNEIDRAGFYDSVTESFLPIVFSSCEHADDFIEWMGGTANLNDCRDWATARSLYRDWFIRRVNDQTGELTDYDPPTTI